MIVGVGSFINGEKEGYWEEYLSSGELVGSGNYKNGKEEGIWGFYEDGELKNKRTFKNGKSMGGWYIDKNSLNEGKSYNYTLDKETPRVIKYIFKDNDDNGFEVLFYNLGDDKWEREYGTNKNGLGLIKTNDVYNIMETVTNITLDFIKKYEPKKITITHIYKNKEIDFSNLNNPNKRALLNKRYLKPAIAKLDDYFYTLIGSTSIVEKI
jgi:hypothetical protein